MTMKKKKKNQPVSDEIIIKYNIVLPDMIVRIKCMYLPILNIIVMNIVRTVRRRKVIFESFRY